MSPLLLIQEVKNQEAAFHLSYTLKIKLRADGPGSATRPVTALSLSGKTYFEVEVT